LHPLWEALGERRWVRGALAAEAAALAGAPDATLAGHGRLDAELLQASLDLLLLGCGRRRDRPVDIDPVAAGLDLRDDLRHLPLLMHGLESEAGGDRRHSLQGGDLVRLRLREGQLRARQEEVVDELRPSLAQLGEVGDDGLVRLDDVAPAPVEGSAARILLRSPGHGQVGADPRERVERRALRLVEPLREARDRDHEADADGKAEQRQDRAAAAAQELGAQVPEVEHTRIEPR
jgi:hypothetical protein